VQVQAQAKAYATVQNHFSLSIINPNPHNYLIL